MSIFAEKELNKLTECVWMPLEDFRCLPMFHRLFPTETLLQDTELRFFPDVADEVEVTVVRGVVAPNVAALDSQATVASSVASVEMVEASNLSLVGGESGVGRW